MITAIAVLLVFGIPEVDCVHASATFWNVSAGDLYALRRAEGTDRLNPISSGRPHPWSPEHPWKIAGPWQVTHGRYGHFRAEILISSMCLAAFDAAKYLHVCRRICGKSHYLECWHEGPSARHSPVPEDGFRWTGKILRIRRQLQKKRRGSDQKTPRSA